MCIGMAVAFRMSLCAYLSADSSGMFSFVEVCEHATMEWSMNGITAKERRLSETENQLAAWPCGNSECPEGGTA